MEEIKQFTHQFRCERGTPFTHTSIGKPAYSINVPNEKLIEFYNVYSRAMEAGVALHLTEKPTNPSMMRADFDFRFALPDPKPEPLPRMYLDADIQRILVAYFDILSSAIVAPDEDFIAYVMEKKHPVENRGKLKDGIHIVWPKLIVSNDLQHWVRRKVLDRGPLVFTGLPLTNSFDDVVDHHIIDKCNWQMYGSSKPDMESYRVTQIWRYDVSDRSLVDMSALVGRVPESHYVSMFSMRAFTEPTELRADKAEEIEQYVKHVMPAMDERRKTKLHQQIFTQSINYMRNQVPEEELKLAKELVGKCLNPGRADNYDDWIKLGWVLRNIDYRLLTTWIEFSKMSSKFIGGECEKMWDSMRVDTLGMGTLRWWAKKDNFAKYNEILSDNVITLIDRCAGSDGAHFDVARVVHALFKDTYRFTTKDIWYTFNPAKHRWVRTKEGLYLRLLLSMDICSKFLERGMHYNTEAMRNPDSRDILEDKSKKLQNIALKLKSCGYKDSIMKECKALFTDERFEELLDSHAHLIGFENGVYDLRMHEFREGLPDDYISFSTGRHYIPYDSQSIEAKEVEGFFEKIFTNPSVRRYVKDVLTIILDGSIRQEKFYMFTGSGSNGKSKILELVQKAIGEYYCILPISLLTQKRAASNAAQAELERTKGRRFAVMQEPGDNEKLNIGLMKELSGGDRILARGLFKEPIEFRPQFKMIMTCNELPEVSSDDGGTWRRIRVMEFTSKFTDAPNPAIATEFPIDMELSEKFDRWAETFISMLIEHHKKLNPAEIEEPMEVRIATEGYKKNNDIIGQFVSEYLVRDPTVTNRVLINNLYIDFKNWSVKVGHGKGKKLPDRNQLKAYIEKIFGQYPASGWRGIRIINQDAEEEEDD